MLALFAPVTRWRVQTVMAEWWESSSFETRYYIPYRKAVDAALHEMERAAGTAVSGASGPRLALSSRRGAGPRGKSQDSR